MVFAISAVLFLIFLANVVLGAFADAAFMGDVAEMIVLFLTSITYRVRHSESRGPAQCRRVRPRN